MIHEYYILTVLQGKVTKSVKTLKAILKHTGDEGALFDHDNIDHEEVTDVVSDLMKDIQAVEELHLRFEVNRKHETGPVEDALML